MTATDSSHLEPDIASATSPIQHETAVVAGLELPSGPSEPAQPAAVSLAKDGVSDFDQADSDDKPRATRVVEGAWLGGVCTGLARHLGWPLLAVRIAFVALATFQFLGVIVLGGSGVVIAAGIDCQGSWAGVGGPAGMRHQQAQASH